MSAKTNDQEKPQGLSVGTLLIASLSSIAAAIFIHEFWTGGAILGAGITPIIVAIVSESLKRPQQRLAARRQTRVAQGPSAMRGAPEFLPVEPEEPQREDRFGIWEADKPERRRGFQWVRGPALKVAIATGAVAFVVGGFLLTGAELVLGGAGGGDRLTLAPGKQRQQDTPREDRDEEPAATQPAETTPTTPQTQPTTPETVPTVPPATTPTAPPPTTTTPPPTTTPAPQTPETPTP